MNVGSRAQVAEARRCGASPAEQLVKRELETVLDAAGQFERKQIEFLP